MAKETSVLVNELYPKVNDSLSNKKILDELMLDIQKYFDYNSDKIFNMVLHEKLLFLNTDKDNIYKATGLNQTIIKSAISKSSYIKNSWKILNEPLNTASILAIRYFTINKKEKELRLMLVYYSFYFYASLYHKYLPYGANESIMSYTVNNLSNKFNLKQLGSLYKTIEHTALKCHETYEKDLIRGEDGDLAKYVSALKVRLNDFMKNIKNEYTKNHRDGKFMNFDSDSFDEDNFHQADNTSFAIKRISDASTAKLVSYGADMKLAKVAAQLSQVSQSEIRNVILKLSDDDTEKINRLSELILQLFLFDDNNRIEEVNMQKFLLKCMEIYKKSNTNDPVILEIKAILDEWLGRYSEKYKKTNREATLSYYRRAIFLYFVLHIQINTR